jgi:LacI family sucrose operon transcriptional repressor
MKKTKLKDIAKMSGVSITTVSRYFNKPHLLSEETRSVIKDAVKELNYSQDNLARILVTGKSNLVGVIFPHLHLSFYTELLNQLIYQGKQKGYSFIVYTSNDSKEDELELINNLISYRIKGLILLSHLLNSTEIEELNMPVVSIERQGGNYRQINNDNFTGGKLAGELLLRNGCEAFIHINNGYHEDWPSFKRIVGFEFALKGFPYEICIEEDLTDPYSEIAAKTMHRITTEYVNKYKNKKIGFFCSNDDIANLLLRECIQQELQIPDHVEIIGYDNSPVSDYAAYPITSINQNIPLMAKIVIDSLDNYLPHESIVPASLVEKCTTRSNRLNKYPDYLET